MKKVLLLTIFLVALCWSVGASLVSAAAFSSASIRPGTHTINSSPLPILISVRTSTVATEDSLQITVPSGYQLSGTASNYSVSTALLPDGYQVWPGISTATTVSGSEITFPSGDLQAGITYGFYLTGGIISNPAAVSGAESVWYVETLASGGTIDASYVTVPVEVSSEISISATVPPASTNFNVALSSTSSATVSQNNVAHYQLKYSTVYAVSTPLTVVATWSRGTVSGSSTPSIDIAEYLSGSASDGFGGAVPVIDPVERTITWEIPSISAADGEQSVNFSLLTTQNYTGGGTVTFDVTAAITEPAVSLPSTITKTYSYLSPPGTSSPGSSSSGGDETSTSTPTPIPTAMPTLSTPLSILTVSVPTLTDTTADIDVLLSEPATIELLYGTSPSRLNQRLLLPEIARRHRISLPDLESSVTYYFRIRATSVSGKIGESDLYSVTTTSEPPLDITAMITSLSYKGIPLTANVVGDNLQTVITPENLNYELVVHFPKDVVLKSLRVTIISTELEQVGGAYQFPLTQVGEGTYLGTIRAVAPGTYSIYYEIEDFVGNRQSVFVGSLKVVPPIRVIDAQSKEPIEDIQLHIERFNEALQLYEKVVAQDLNLPSSWISDNNGVFETALAAGKYRLTFSSSAYEEKVIEIIINDMLPEYPLVELERRSDYYFSRINYYSETIQRAFDDGFALFTSVLESRNIFKVLSFLSLCLLAAGLLLALSVKTHIPVFRLPAYVLSKLQHLGPSRSATLLQGKVINSHTKAPISRADIALINKKGEVILNTQTAANGYFHAQLPNSPHSLLITEQGFLPVTYVLPTQLKNSTLLFKLTNTSALSRTESTLALVLKFVTSSLFELILIGFCIAQFFFAKNFGIAIALPFIIISGINLIIWTLYMSTQSLPQQFTEIESVSKNS